MTQEVKISDLKRSDVVDVTLKGITFDSPTTSKFGDKTISYCFFKNVYKDCFDITASALDDAIITRCLAPIKEGDRVKTGISTVSGSTGIVLGITNDYAVVKFDLYDTVGAERLVDLTHIDDASQ